MTGYCRTKSSDPVEQELRDAWHLARKSVEDGDEFATGRFARANNALCNYLWRRAGNIVAADRAKHPKAKRNAPVGSMGKSGDRRLP